MQVRAKAAQANGTGVGLLVLVLSLTSPISARADAWTDACEAIRSALGAPAPAPGALAAQPLALHEHFERAEAIGFSGSAFVDERGELLLAEGYGFADWTTSRPVTPSIIFDIGSVSKQFTAAAILKLEEMGRLNVDDQIGRFFPTAPVEKRSITIHQLLTHTAGFRQEELSAAYASSYDQALAIMLESQLLARPGETYSYSNLGYALLGAIIQVASGQDYESFLRQHLWEPAGLLDTGWTVADQNADRYAEGSAFRHATPHPTARIAGGTLFSRRGPGSIYSSPEDLRLWVHALRSGTVLSRASTAKLVAPHFPETPGGRAYAAYGWVVSVTQSGICTIAHNGGNSLVYNVLRVYPEQGLITHEMTLNEPGPLGRRVVSPAPLILFGRRESPLPEVVTVDADEVRSLAGVWRSETGEEVELRTAGQLLYASTASSNVIRLFTGFELLTRSDQQRVEPLVARLPFIMDALHRRDYEPLFEALREGESREEEMQYWPGQWAQWEDRLGAYLGAEVIETVREDDRLSTYLLLRFERSSAIANVRHHDGGGITIGTRISHGDAQEFVPSQYVLTPAGPGFYRVHNPEFPSGVDVWVEDDGALRLRSPRGQRVLRPANE